MPIAFQDAVKGEIWETVRRMNDPRAKGDGKDLGAPLIGEIGICGIFP